MNTRKLFFLEKLPVYFVACSVVLSFVLLAAISLELYPFSEVCAAVLKAKFMLIAAVLGTVLSLCIPAARFLKEREKSSGIHLARILLFSLAYFTFYFGVNKLIVVGICLVGIPISVLSIQEIMSKRAHR